MKNLYKVTSENCLFFVCSDLSVEEIERAYLTELNNKHNPRTYCNVTPADLRTVNHIRYKGQPVYSLKKTDEKSFSYGLYIEAVIRKGYAVITEEDLL